MSRKTTTMRQTSFFSSLTWKLMIAPAVIIVLLVFYGAFTSHSLTSMEGHIAELNDSVNMERLAQEAEASVNAMHATMYRGVNMAMSRDEKNREAAKKLTFRQLAVLNDLRFALSTTREPRFETFIGQYMDYLKNVRQAQEIIDQDPAQSLDILRNTDKTYDELIHSLLLLGSEGRIHAEALRAQLEQQIHTLRLLQAALLGLAVLLAMAVAYLVGQRIVRPLKKVQAQLAVIEKNHDFSARVPVESADEVGQTAQSVNALLDSVQAGLQAVSSTVDALANGDFQQKVTTNLRGDLASMVRTVNATVDSLAQTMGGLNQIMTAMSQGQFSVQVDVQARGAYQQTVQQAISTLQAMERMLGDIGQVMQAAAQGNLGMRVSAQGQGDLEVLKRNINTSLSSLAHAMGTISQNARQVAGAAADSSEAIGQISDGAQNQTHAISQVTAAVRQTAAAVTDVSRSTEMASQRSRESVQVLRDGLGKIEKMVEVVNNIAANSGKISKITEVIESIANKTNLLSLNAAIEAARAGEHGKGFAVVADEVGKLAVNSAESSKEIAVLVQQATQETAKAVAAVQAVSADMAQIELGSQETDEMLRRIATSLEQQSAAVEQINVNLSSVDAIARSNAAASEEITASIMELAKIADTTRQEVDRFRV
jgi:methyl-accepting chemotaxis protein